MGICEILTIIFAIAKLLGVIKWAWLYVFIPEIIAFVIYIVVLLGYCFFAYRLNKELKD